MYVCVELPSVMLGVEMVELGITAGLQDRVIQVYGGLVYMDFRQPNNNNNNASNSNSNSEKRGGGVGVGVGVYERMDVSLLPPLYLAFDTLAGEVTQRSEVK